MKRFWMLLFAAMFFAGCTQSPRNADKMETAAASRSPAIGKIAPDFTLTQDNDTKFTLSALRGKWVVLYFYPQDDTPGCTCQATEFTKLLASFNTLDATVVGVSPDPPGIHRLFKAEYKIQLTLLSDPTRVVMSNYGAYVTTHIGGTQESRVIRSTFLIDPSGSIAYHWPEVIPQGHAERVRQVLKEFQSRQAASNRG